MTKVEQDDKWERGMKSEAINVDVDQSCKQFDRLAALAYNMPRLETLYEFEEVYVRREK
jgi:hypothetical protein